MTTSAGDAATAPATRPIPTPPIVPERRGARSGVSRLLLVSLVLMLAGSWLASWLNAGAGTASIKDIKIFGTN
ncbi:MAG: hypothetical protein JO057_11165, partial [Chloroflexi bacterium]|nr:hypothetical protein [Chloroflexota bacterium]